MSSPPRDEIKRLIKENLESKLSNESGTNDHETLEEYVDPRAEQILNEYEKRFLSDIIDEKIIPSYLYGVTQTRLSTV